MPLFTLIINILVTPPGSLSLRLQIGAIVHFVVHSTSTMEVLLKDQLEQAKLRL